MATKYTLLGSDGSEIKTFARKDAAIKAATADSMLAFSVVTDTGKVVHEFDNRPAAPVTQIGPTTEVEFNHGAKYFFTEMAAGAVALAEGSGLTAVAEKGSVVLSGGDARTRKSVAKQIEGFWTAQYEAFKAWKKENWAARKELRKTNDHAAIRAAEEKFFAEYSVL